MNPTNADRGITLINTLTVDPARQQELIALLRENVDTVVSRLEGWISTGIFAAQDRTRVVIWSRWRDLDAVRAMQSDADMRAYFPRIGALATFDSVTADLAYSRQA